MDQRQQYVEEFGLFLEQLGMTRMAGRMLAWLPICDPPHQTMQELTEALRRNRVETIHTQKATLEQIFIESTGRSLQ